MDKNVILRNEHTKHTTTKPNGYCRRLRNLTHYYSQFEFVNNLLKLLLKHYLFLYFTQPLQELLYSSTHMCIKNKSEAKLSNGFFIQVQIIKLSSNNSLSFIWLRNLSTCGDTRSTRRTGSFGRLCALNMIERRLKSFFK